MKAKALKKLLAGVTTLAMAAQFAFVLPANAATNSVAYDFEDGNAVFVDRSRFTVAIERNEGLSSNVVSFTGAHNAQNGYCFANYDFSELVDLATSLNIEFDYYNTQGGRAILTLGDASVRGETGGSGKATYSNTGAAFNLGSNKDNSILNDKTTSLESYTNKWMHVALEVDESTNTYTYKITDKTGNILTQSESAVEFLNPNASSITQIDVFGYINDSKCAFIDNLKISAEIPEGNVYALTYNVEGNITTEQVIEGGLPQNIPSTDKTGYIFQGWKINGGGEIISTEELKKTPVMADVTYTAVYKEDPNYIEPIVSAVITGPSSMEIGPDSDTPASNDYHLELTGEIGTVITAENADPRVDDFNIEWTLSGFKTQNDMEGQYCDSYGAFAEYADTATDISFLLKQVSFNFYGTLSAKVTYAGDEISASMPVVALGDTTSPSNAFLPKAGYPSDINEYYDDVIGHKIMAETYGSAEGDLIFGGWAVTGSDNVASTAAIASDESGKFVRLTTASGNSHLLSAAVPAFTTQALFEQDIRFGNAGGCLVLSSRYPNQNEMVNATYDGGTINLNGTPITDVNGNEVDIHTDTWYKIVLSADKSVGTCYVLVYDGDGTYLGGAENVALNNKDMNFNWFSVAMAGKTAGKIDMNNYSAYYPVADTSSYMLSSSADTLSIPNGDTARLEASLSTADGYKLTGEATWSILEDDMKEGVIITPDADDSHKATVSLSDSASAGTATVQVSIGGYAKTIQLNITSSKESIKFTSSSSSVSIPLDDTTTSVTYKAEVVDGQGTTIEGKTTTLAVYDKNNTNAYTLPEGISFDAETGVLTVEKTAVPCTFAIRATGENTDGETISRYVVVTVHGLSFDFGTAEDGAVVEGYTAVASDTAYTETRGYGIEGSAVAGGSASDTDAVSDYLEGTFIFKANVMPGELYRVTVDFAGDLMTEYHDSVIAGHTRTLAADDTQFTGYTIRTDEIAQQVYDVPVVDDVLDLHFTNAKVAAIQIEKVTREANPKPSVYSIGDSTLGRNGSYGYVLANNQANYPELTSLITRYNNNGKSSRTLSTYATQGWLDGVLASIKPGDVVTIGNMGTNSGGLSGEAFKAPLEYYVDACIAMGAKVILTSYTPHGAVGDYSRCYNSETHTFNGARDDAYDSLGIRVIYEERKNDPNILGFIEIGNNADAAFNAYVADFEKHGYADENAAAQAIISCFEDHNHYKGLATELMLNGYGDVKGIVAQLVDILSAQQEPEEPTVSAGITSAENADGKTTVSASITVENGPVEMKAYAAIYDESGAMLGVKKLSGEGAAEVVFENAGNAATAKVFVWKTGEGNEMIPFCDAAEADVTE